MRWKGGCLGTAYTVARPSVWSLLHTSEDTLHALDHFFAVDLRRGFQTELLSGGTRDPVMANYTFYLARLCNLIIGVL